MSEALGEAHEIGNKKVALLIAALALLLAFSEAGGKNAQHHATEHNIEASDLFNFYQAKVLRATVLQTQAEELEMLQPAPGSDGAAITKKVSYWKDLAKTAEDDPKNGFRVLNGKAKEAGEARDRSNLQNEHFEVSSGILQVAIVLASASIITAVGALVWVAGAMGIVGVTLMAFGQFAPAMLPFFH